MLSLKTTDFSSLPAWQQANPVQSFFAFQRSCRAFLKQNPAKDIGTPLIPMRVGDWTRVCQAAVQHDDISKIAAKHFFETWFVPVAFHEEKPVEGLFTGYYLPEFEGSLVQSKAYPVPVYGVPSNLVTVHLHDFDAKIRQGRWVGRVQGRRLVPYYTRKEINEGALKGVARVIVWLKHPIDRLTLEIEGSGLVKLNNGKRLALGYAAQNGAPYTPIARVLIERGVMTYDNASMQRIRAYLDAHPDEVEDVLN
ncbi:MAG: MltA domain-containing protein, partial [Legionellaceae bacterium]